MDVCQKVGEDSLRSKVGATSSDIPLQHKYKHVFESNPLIGSSIGTAGRAEVGTLSLYIASPQGILALTCKHVVNGLNKPYLLDHIVNCEYKYQSGGEKFQILSPGEQPYQKSIEAYAHSLEDLNNIKVVSNQRLEFSFDETKTKRLETRLKELESSIRNVTEQKAIAEAYDCNTGFLLATSGDHYLDQDNTLRRMDWALVSPHISYTPNDVARLNRVSFMLSLFLISIN